MSDATWQSTMSGSLTGASTTITGTFFRFASARLPRMPSQFTGLTKIAAGRCWSRSEMSFFCFRLLNWASRVTNRSPCAAITRERPSFRSTKNGLFIVWNDTTKRRPFPAPAAPGPAGPVGTPPPHPNEAAARVAAAAWGECAGVSSSRRRFLGCGGHPVRVDPGRPARADRGRATRRAGRGSRRRSGRCGRRARPRAGRRRRSRSPRRCGRYCIKTRRPWCRAGLAQGDASGSRCPHRDHVVREVDLHFRAPPRMARHADERTRWRRGSRPSGRSWNGKPRWSTIR